METMKRVSVIFSVASYLKEQQRKEMIFLSLYAPKIGSRMDLARLFMKS